jgi:hypothetical protein
LPTGTGKRKYQCGEAQRPPPPTPAPTRGAAGAAAAAGSRRRSNTFRISATVFTYVGDIYTDVFTIQNIWRKIYHKYNDVLKKML